MTSQRRRHLWKKHLILCDVVHLYLRTRGSEGVPDGGERNLAQTRKGVCLRRDLVMPAVTQRNCLNRAGHMGQNGVHEVFVVGSASGALVTDTVTDSVAWSVGSGVSVGL